MKKKYKIGLIVASIFIVTIISGVSYAYFTAIVNGNTNAQATVITTGNMSLVLDDGEAVSGTNLIPGNSVTKTFSVRNNGNIETVYDVYLSEIVNTFADKSDLVYRITSSNGGCQTTSNTVVYDKSSEQSKIVSSCSIAANVTHNYTLTIEYLETNDNQDDNKGRKFSGKISVNSFKEADLTALDLMINNPDLVDYNRIDHANNYRFTGNNPDNYATLNGSSSGWRVVGIFNGYVKLVRNYINGNGPIFTPGSTTLDWDNSMFKGAVQSAVNGSDSALIDNHAWCVGSTNGSGSYLDECSSTITNKGGLLTLNDMKVANGWLFKYYNVTAPAWTLTGDSTADHSVFAYAPNKTSYSMDVSSTSPVSIGYYLPSVYLISDVKVKGSGTVEDPYVFYTSERPEYTYITLNDLKTRMTDYSSIDGEGIYRYTGTAPTNNVIFNGERDSFKIIGIFDDHVKLVRTKTYSVLESTEGDLYSKSFGNTNAFAASNVKTYLDGLDVNNNPLVVSHDYGVGTVAVDATATYANVMASKINTKVGLADIYDVQQAPWLKKYDAGVSYSYSWTLTPADLSRTLIYGTSSGTVMASNPLSSHMAAYTVYLSDEVKVRGSGTANDPYVFVSTRVETVNNDIEEKLIANMTDYSSTDGAGIYRYTGSNPNNYVKLSDNSVWRVISVENGVPKIVKADTIGAKQWDSGNSNVWSTSSLAAYLNSNSFDYYSNSLVSAHDYCVTKVLNPAAVTYSDLCSTTWNGKIALPNAYEINQAAWLQTQFGGTIWTLTGSTWNDSTSAIHIYTSSGYDGDGAQDALHTLVAMYLKANLHVSGTGTSADPFIFSE